MTPSEIFNPHTGQRMRFVTERDDRELLRIECWSDPNGDREPEHVHAAQESRIVMIDGELIVRIRDRERRLLSGDEAVIDAGVRHRFWNEADTRAHYGQEFRPALRMRELFEVMFRLAEEGKLDDHGMPSATALAVLVPAFSREIRPTTPPWALLRVIAAALRPLAIARRLRGPDDL